MRVAQRVLEEPLLVLQRLGREALVSPVVDTDPIGYSLIKPEVADRIDRAVEDMALYGRGGTPPPPDRPDRPVRLTGGMRPWCSTCGAMVPKPCNRLDCENRIIGDGQTYGAGWPD